MVLQKWVDTVMELMEAVDTVGLNYQKETLIRTFLMPIEDVFSITGRGTVATGRIETGIAKYWRSSRNHWYGCRKIDIYNYWY